MKYTMTSPCDQCPFLDTPNEKRETPNQMMRICERS